MSIERNLEFLKPGEHTESFDLVITPLGPLSMQMAPTGQHYAAFVEPPDSALYGMVENALLIWADEPTKKKLRKEAGVSAPPTRPGYKFYPVVHDALSFKGKTIPPHVKFVDLRSRLWSAPDDRHMGGIKNIDESMLMIDGPEISIRKNTHPHLVDGSQFSETVRSRLPMYYSAPKTAEWVRYSGDILVRCSATASMLGAVTEALSSRSSYYLGNSESIVEIKIRKI